MERVKMVLCGVAILSLLFAFAVPVAHGQAGGFDIAGQGKFKVKGYTNAGVQTFSGGGKGLVVLFENAGVSMCDGAGFSYDVVVIDNYDEEGAPCDLIQIGILDTCLGEESAVGFLIVDEIPDGTTNYVECYFNGPVNNLTKFGSKAGYCDLYDAGDNWLGLSKTAKFSVKEKNIDKKVKCIP